MKLDVIIPVGPNHEKLFHRAAHSVSQAKDMAERYVRKGMPFERVRILHGDDSKGEVGRSRTRNNLVKQSDADWLFFLDADDLMHPKAIFNASFDMDEVHDVLFGQIVELHHGLIMERYQVPVIESYEQLIADDPYMTLSIGQFCRRQVAVDNPFNEDMDCGEDWDFYLRQWKNYRCSKRQYPLIINDRSQHSTGPRSATGADWSAVVGAMLEKARKDAA